MIDSINKFYEQNGVEVCPLPKIVLNKDKTSRFDCLVKTGTYDCRTSTIHLWIDNRHVKDILRSYCHELVHHNQFLTDPAAFSECDKSGRIADNEELRQYEADAFLRGNLLFRQWTEQFTMSAQASD